MNRQARSLLSLLIGCIPNLLSLARLALGLGFVCIPTAWRVPVVLVAALTDILDGPISRKLHAELGAGRWLDPLADKVFALGVVWVVVADGTLELWQALLVGLRDLIVLVGGVIVLLRRDQFAWDRMRPTLLGKAVTAAQFVFFLSLLIFAQVVLALFIVTAVLSVAAAVDYARRFVARERANHHGQSRVEDVQQEPASR